MSVPYLEDIKEKAVLGSFSITTQQTKYVQEQNLIGIDGQFDTVPSVCRDWIDLSYGKSIPYADAETRAACAVSIASFKPQLARPGVYSDMAMVDLKSAYWSIIKVLGYTCTYRPNKSLSGGERMGQDEWLFGANKTARAMLIATALKGGLWLWDGKGGIKYQAKPNYLQQDMLVACVYDVLHAIAAECKDLFVYYNVDGGIMHSSHVPIWEEACESWGIRTAIKAQGYALVRSIGSYSIGRLETAGRKARLKEFDNFKPRNEWLRVRFKKLAELNG